jgi:hypothetical protein
MLLSGVPEPFCRLYPLNSEHSVLAAAVLESDLDLLVDPGLRRLRLEWVLESLAVAGTIGFLATAAWRALSPDNATDASTTVLIICISLATLFVPGLNLRNARSEGHLMVLLPYLEEAPRRRSPAGFRRPVSAEREKEAASTDADRGSGWG